MPDLALVKRNISKMVDQNAPEEDIDAYIASEGSTVDEVRSFKSQEKSTARDVSEQFWSHAAKGSYELLNAPTDIANYGARVVKEQLNRIPGQNFNVDERTFKRPLEVAAPEFDKKQLNPPEAQTPLGEISGTIGDYAAANAPMAAGLIGMAPRLAAATRGAQSTLGSLANRTATAIAANPGKAAVGEAIATVGAGTGAQIARDVAPDSPTAEVIGATIGGLGLQPAASFIKGGGGIGKGYRYAKSKFSPNAIADRQDEAIRTGIRKNLTPDDEATIRETYDIQKNIPDYKPSVAEATESPSFIASQKDFESNLSGNELDQAIKRYEKNELAVSGSASQNAPQSSLAPEDVFDQARKRPKSLIDRIDAAEESLKRQSSIESDNLQSGSRKRELGGQIREDIKTNRSGVKDTMKTIAVEMGLNDTKPVYRFDKKVKKELIDSVKPRSKLADQSAIPNSIISDIEKMKDTASITDFIELRSRISDDIRANLSRADGKKRIDYLKTLQSSLDDVSDKVIREAGNDNIAENWKTFRDVYRRDLIEPFEQGAIGKVLKKDIAGTYKVPDEEVAKEFFNGWKESAADQFKNTLKNSTSANAAMESAAFDDLHNFAVKNGELDPARIEAWRNKNAGVIRSFPEINKRVSNLQSTMNGIARRQKVLAGRRVQVEESYLSKELERLDNPLGATTPEKIIDDAVKNPARMQRLLRSVKSDEAKNAIARHIWDTALNNKNPAKFLKDNANSIAPALKEKYKTALMLARAVEKNNLVQRPSGSAVDTNPLEGVENFMGSGINQMSSRVFAVKSGRTSARYVLIDMASRFFRNMTKNQARKTMQEALYDPKVAMDIVNSVEKKAVTPESVKRLYTFIISSGIASEQEEK